MTPSDQKTLGHRACPHITDRSDYEMAFQGVGAFVDVYCPDCSQLDKQLIPWRPISEAQLWDIDHCWASKIHGEPQLIESNASQDKSSASSIVPNKVLTYSNNILNQAKTFALVLGTTRPSLWFIDDQMCLQRLDLDDGAISKVIRLECLNSDDLTIECSKDGRIVAVAETFSERAVVIDLRGPSITMLLTRDGYHAEHCYHSLAFFESDQKSFLVYSTDWNRLDIIDPLTGIVLTKREGIEYREQGNPNYLDYFHCRLHISPDGRYIADDGWVWHPAAVVRIWDLQYWHQQNPLESECGESVWTVDNRIDNWGLPMCFIDNNTLALWGYGPDGHSMFSIVQILDLQKQTRKGMFAVERPKYMFYDSSHLVIVHDEGLSLWLIETKERVAQFKGFCPSLFRPENNQYFCLNGDTVEVWQILKA